MMDIGQEERACPMCQKRSASTLHQTKYNDRSFDIVKCIGCDFVYVKNPSGATFSPSPKWPSCIPVKRRHFHIKAICDRHFSTGSVTAKKPRMVEIGAGWGGLAKVIRDHGNYEYIGFEPSDSRSAFCRENGLNVRQEEFCGVSAVASADAIVIDNVLEHVDEPDKLVRDAVSILPVGGLLVVIVPNVHDVRQYKPRWRDRHLWQPHCHINYFSSRHIKSLFIRHGVHGRFFGFEILGGMGGWNVAPRVLMDKIGVHLLGLNCYGIKAAAAPPEAWTTAY